MSDIVVSPSIAATSIQFPVPSTNTILERKKRQILLTVTLVRHGETEDNSKIPRILQGQLNTSLNPKGEEQSKAVAWRLRNYKFDSIYTSDLQRAVQTTKFIVDTNINSQNKEQDVVLEDQRLREQDFGDLTGKTWRSIKANLLQQDMTFDQYLLSKKAETTLDFEQRVKDFYDQLIEDHLIKPHEQFVELNLRARAGLTDLPLTDEHAVISPSKLTNDLSYFNTRYDGLKDNSSTLTDSPVSYHADEPIVFSTTESNFSTGSESPTRRVTNDLLSQRNESISSSGRRHTVDEKRKKPTPCLITRKPSQNKVSSISEGSTVKHQNSGTSRPRLFRLREQNILIVSHGGWIKNLISHITNLGFSVYQGAEVNSFPKNAGIYQFQIVKEIDMTHYMLDFNSKITSPMKVNASIGFPQISTSISSPLSAASTSSFFSDNLNTIIEQEGSFVWTGRVTLANSASHLVKSARRKEKCKKKTKGLMESYAQYSAAPSFSTSPYGISDFRNNGTCTTNDVVAPAVRVKSLGW